MRIDKWLWTVRVFKTRTLATEAIKGGHVKVDGAASKPAHEARIGETITVWTGDLTRTLKVLGHPTSRVAGKLVALFAEDLTPESERQRQREARLLAPPPRPKGMGRPTKRDRRVLERFSGGGIPE